MMFDETRLPLAVPDGPRPRNQLRPMYHPQALLAPNERILPQGRVPRHGGYRPSRSRPAGPRPSTAADASTSSQRT